MKTILNENLSLTNEQIQRNQTILKGKNVSLVREFEGKKIENLFLSPFNNVVRMPLPLSKKPMQKKRKCLEFLKALLREKFLTYFSKNSKINNNCLKHYFKQISKLSTIISFSIDFFCFLIFFFYLQLKNQFVFSFPMIFEIIVTFFLIFGLMLKLIPKKTHYFMYLITFLIPFIDYILPNNYSYINPYMNIFRGFRIIKIEKICNRFLKTILKRHNFSEINEKFVDLALLFLLFLMIGVVFLMTQKFTEQDPRSILDLFLETELMMFNCLNTISCEEVYLVDPRMLQVFILIFIIIYFTCLFEKIFETLEVFYNKGCAANPLLFKNPDPPSLMWFRSKKNISFVGLPSIKMMEHMFYELDLINGAKCFYEIVIFLDKEKIQMTNAFISQFLKKRKNILSFKIILTNFLSRQILSEKLKILKKSNYIFGYLEKQENYLTNNFYLKLITLQKLMNPHQKMLIFTSIPLSKKRNQIIMMDKIRDLCIANIIANPCLSLFFQNLTKKNKSFRNFLTMVKLPPFFINKTFQESSKIISFSSFYCKEVKNEDDSSIHTMVVVLGVSTATQTFVLNPSKYSINTDDRVLILTNDVDSVAYIENFNELNFKKYQQINDLFESSYKNLDEEECSEADFMKNLNITKPQKKNMFFPPFIDLFLNVHATSYDFENHYIIFVYDPLMKIYDHLHNIISRIKENEPKTNIVLFTNQNNFEIFEHLSASGCCNFYGSFFNSKHINFVQISKCNRLVILSSKSQNPTFCNDIFGKFLYQYFKEKYSEVKIFLESEYDCTNASCEQTHEIFTDSFFFAILSKYSLNENMKLFFDGLMNENCLDYENILCTLHLNDKLATKFKNYGNLFLFFFNLGHSIIPLGMASKSAKEKKKTTLISENENKEEFITNPEMTLKLKKGNEVLLLMKKG